MRDEVKDAPWIGMGRREYEESHSLYNEREEEYFETKADHDYRMAQEEEILRKSRHSDVVWGIYYLLITTAIGEENAISASQLSLRFGI